MKSNVTYSINVEILELFNHTIELQQRSKTIEKLMVIHLKEFYK